MKKIFFIVAILFATIQVSGQATNPFPTTDSLIKFVNRFVRNSPVESFQNLRLNTSIIGLAKFVENSYGGQIVSFSKVNDSTLRIITLGGDTLSVTGIAGSGSVDLDSLRNATQLRLINGTDTTIFQSATEALAGAFPAADKFKVNRWEPYLNYTDLRAKTNLDTSVIYVDKKMNWFRYDASDVSSADDTAMVIVTTGGGRLKRVIDDRVYPEYFGAVGNGTTNDAYAFQKMFNWLATATNNFEISFKSKEYKINTRVTLPATLNANQTHEFLLMQGYGTIIRTDSAISIFYRQPADGLLTQSLSDYKLIVRGLAFRGTATTGQKAIEFGATYGSEIVDCHFNQFDTALVLRFWLKGRIANCFFSANKTMGIYCGHYQGLVSGATIAGSAFNSNIIEGCRFHNLAGSYASVMMIAADAMMVRDCVSEGARPRYCFYYDFDGSTNVNTNTFENLWLEFPQTGPYNTNFYFRPSQQLILRNIQRIAPDTLFEIGMNPGANSSIIIEDIPYMSNFPDRPFNANGQIMTGSSIHFRNLQYGNVLVPLDSTRWVGGILPTNVMSEGELDANGGPAIVSNNVISLRPRKNVAAASRWIDVDGGIFFSNDNTNSIGGISSNNRPSRIAVGTGGIRVDNAGAYGFGDLTTTPTVTISRPATNSIGFSTASTERGRWNATGTFQINTTASTSDINRRRLYINGSIGANKDSIPSISQPTTHFLLLQDTSAAPALGQFNKLSPSYFASQSALNDTAAAIRAALIDSIDGITHVEGPLYVEYGADTTIKVRYDTTTIGIRTTGVNDSALTVNTDNISTVQRLIDSAAALRADFSAGGLTSINSQTGPAITLAAGSGMQVNNTTNTVTYTWGGPITASTLITGGGNQLSLGTVGSKLSSFAAVTTGNSTIQSDARIFLLGNISYNADFYGSDANHTVAANTQILQLGTSSLTTDRTVTLPSAATHGQTLTIVVDFASSGSHFVLASAIQDNKTGATFTQLEWGTTYDLMVDNTLNWKVIRKY